MKSKILLILLAAVLALSVGLVGCGGGVVKAESPTIIIGMSRSLDGSLAIIHTSAFGSVYPPYIGILNAGGGIQVGAKKFLVDVKVYNDKSDTTKLATNANSLVSDVKKGLVHTVFGPTCTYYIDLMAPIINDGDCVLITAEGGATFLMSEAAKDRPNLRDWPYVFVSLSFSNWYQLPILAEMLDDATAESVYIFWQDDAHGLEYLAASEIYFGAKGIDIVGNSSVLHTVGYNYDTDVKTVNDMTTDRPDVVCCFCYPDEVQGLTSAAIGGPYNFDAWVSGPCANFGWFGDPSPIPLTPPGYGVNAANVTCFAVANNKTQVSVGAGTMSMEMLFNEVLGTIPASPYVPGSPYVGELGLQDMWGHPLYWAALEMWQAAVAAVGTVGPDGGFLIDQTALKNKLASYNSQPNGVNTVLGTAWFSMYTGGGGLIDYKCHTGEIGQWQDGYIEVVGPAGINATLPNYWSTATFQYPKLDWIPVP